MLGNLAQVLLVPESGDTAQRDFRARVERMIAHEKVLAGFEFAVASGVVSLGSGVHPILAYGVGDDAIDWLPENRPVGDWRGLVLGESLADYFFVHRGDALQLTLIGAEGKTRALRKRITGVFETGSDLDYSLVFLPLETMSKLAPMGIGRVGVRLVVEDALLTPDLIAGWRAQGLLDGIRVEEWTREHGDLVRVLGMERVIMFCLLFMVVGIAALNLVSGQAMLVSEKRSENRHSADARRGYRTDRAHLPRLWRICRAARHEPRARIGHRAGGLVATNHRPHSNGVGNRYFGRQLV